MLSKPGTICKGMSRRRFRGRHGIVNVSPDGEKGEIFVAGNNVIGLCFTRKGEMIVATSEAVFSLPLGIYGTLLN